LTECSSEVQDEWGAMLWCGLGDGRVRVFSLDTLRVDEVYVRAKDRVVCTSPAHITTYITLITITFKEHQFWAPKWHNMTGCHHSWEID